MGKKKAFAVKDASGQQCGKANKKCSECYYRGGPCCESTEHGEKSSTCAQEIQRKEYGNEKCTCAGLQVFKKTIDELNDAHDCVKGTPCKSATTMAVRVSKLRKKAEKSSSRQRQQDH